jgi:hypothetical protein
LIVYDQAGHFSSPARRPALGCIGDGSKGLLTFLVHNESATSKGGYQSGAFATYIEIMVPSANGHWRSAALSPVSDATAVPGGRRFA